METWIIVLAGAIVLYLIYTSSRSGFSSGQCGKNRGGFYPLAVTGMTLPGSQSPQCIILNQ